MINIDMTSIDREFINWNAVIARSLVGERISVRQAGIEVLQIIPTKNKSKSTLDDNGWSEEVKALAGSWADFPSLTEIRSNKGVDVEREIL
ncbi:MAG: hypothetical protein KGV51_05960 [Moraxellaceae bacterium]|nr:hypothetical protein [Moraxellaceae bacterium]